MGILPCRSRRDPRSYTSLASEDWVRASARGLLGDPVDESVPLLCREIGQRLLVGVVDQKAEVERVAGGVGVDVAGLDRSDRSAEVAARRPRAGRRCGLTRRGRTRRS